MILEGLTLKRVAEDEIRDYGDGSIMSLSYELIDSTNKVSVYTKHWLVDCSAAWTVAFLDHDFQPIANWPGSHAGGASGSTSR